MSQYEFQQKLAGNTKMVKVGFLSLTVLLILAIVAIIVSYAFWDDYTRVVYSFKVQSNVTKGWPATLSGWAWGFAIFIPLVMPFLYFMSDWKNPAIATTKEGLFINQQLIRNTLVPWDNIKTFELNGESIGIEFNDNKQILDQQVGLFKPFVKSNLNREKLTVTTTYVTGDLKGFFEEAKTFLTG